MPLPFLRVSTITALACLPATAFGQAKFEGVITFQLGSPQGALDATYSIKGDHVRMDMSGMGGMTMYMLHDGSTGSSMMVIPAMQMYVEPQMPGMAGRAAAEKKLAEFKMTGKKETVAGYECEHMVISGDDGTQTDVCAAKGLGGFVMMNNPMGQRGGGAGASPAWQRLGKDLFPLKVQQAGGGDVTFEVTKIEKKALDDGLFKVPDGFQKMDMGGRMGRPPRGE